MKLGASVLLLIVGVAIFANGYSVHPKYVQGWNSGNAISQPFYGSKYS